MTSFLGAFLVVTGGITFLFSSIDGFFNEPNFVSDKKQFATFAEKRKYYESGDVTVSMSEDEEDLSIEDEVEEVLGEFFPSVGVNAPRGFAVCHSRASRRLVCVRYDDEDKWTLEVEDDSLSLRKLKEVAGRLSRYFDVEVNIQV